ncbi:MAG TPA: DUF4878 domain-containing protein [Thermoanaerobaculia bacterium]
MRILARITLALLAFALVCAPAFGGGGKRDLEATPQAKAYRALLKAVEAGNYEGYKKAMASESAKGMDAQLKESGMDAKKAMALLNAMSPTHLKLEALLVDVDGKKSTLTAKGKVGGEMSTGTIEMVEENGQWKVVKQSWTNK